MTPRARACQTRGFTLIEVVTATAVMGVLLTSLAAMFSLAMKATPRPDQDPAVIASEMQVASTWISDDLAAATSITSINASDMTFIVPDRDSDGATEKIIYRWSGTAGDRLRRSVNGTEMAIGPALAGFALSPIWRKVSTSPVSGTALSSDEIVYCYLGVAGTSQQVTSTSMLGLTFTPAVASDATQVKISSIELTASGQLLTVGTLRARLYLGAVTNTGTQTPLASSPSVSLSVLGAAVIVPFIFADAPEVPAGSMLTVVIDAAITVGRVNVSYSAAGVPSSSMSAQIGGAATWTSYPEGGAPIRIRAKVRRPSRTATEVSRLDSVEVVMTPSKKGVFPARFAVTTPVRPVAP